MHWSSFELLAREMSFTRRSPFPLATMELDKRAGTHVDATLSQRFTETSLMDKGRDLAEHCVEFGRGLGAQYVEARYQSQLARALVYRNGAPVAGGVQPSVGIGVRLLVDGRMGFASFDRLDRGLADDAMTAAFRMAQNSPRKKPIDLGPPVVNKGKWTVKMRESLLDVDTDTLMGLAQEINEQGKGLQSFTVILNPTDTTKYFVTSEGTQLDGHLSHLFINTLITAEGAKGSEQRYLDFTQSGGWERVKEGRVVEQIADEIRRVKEVADKAEKLPELLNQPVDMVVGPEVAGIISHENVGHPSEGDRILGREGAQAGESFWRDLQIGKSRVGSDAVNVSDDPTLPNTGGFYLYDDEGVKARKRRLIKNGVTNEPLLNREFGVRFGMASNGAARAVTYNREPIIRMANTFFEPGDYSLEEIFEDIKLGVYMRSFGEWNIDDRRYQSKYTGTEAYLVKDGEVTETMVRHPVMETTSVGLLTAADAVTKNLSLAFPATCGKGDPAQGVPVYAGGGEVRFRAIRLGGVG